MQYSYSAPTRSLYIHWPFCPYRCTFCPFVALASHDSFMGRYHEALKLELIDFAQKSGQRLPLDTIYFGGGTPSTYPDDLLLDTSVILKTIFDIQPGCEITLEVNPGTVRVEQVAFWKSIGINRLSIGVQSLKDSVLKDLNRHQSQEDVTFLLSHAQDVFDNLSVDLILGLPGVSDEEWKDMLRQVVTWPIKHVSLYFLQVHENTQLYFRVQQNKVVLPCDDAVVDLYYWSVALLAEHGLNQYEVSNFAREGYESRHNRIYWDRKPYKGFGLGACSFDGSMRFQNEKNLMRYMHGMETGQDMTVFHEGLTRKQIYLEKIMLGIRRSQGVMLDEVMEMLLTQEQQTLLKQITELESEGFIKQRDGCIVLTPVGLSVENNIALRLSL